MFCFCVHKSSACQEKQTDFRNALNKPSPVGEGSSPPECIEKEDEQNARPPFDFRQVEPALWKVPLERLFLFVYLFDRSEPVANRSSSAIFDLQRSGKSNLTEQGEPREPCDYSPTGHQTEQIRTIS